MRAAYDPACRAAAPSPVARTSYSPPPVAVFVDGCFWHGCPVHGTQPKANAAFRAAKIDRNR